MAPEFTTSWDLILSPSSFSERDRHRGQRSDGPFSGQRQDVRQSLCGYSHMLVLLSDPRKVEGASSSDKTTSDGASLTVPEPVRGRSPSSSPSRSVCLPPSLPPVLQHSFPASHKSLHSLLYIILGKFQRNFAYSSRYLLQIVPSLKNLPPADALSATKRTKIYPLWGCRLAQLT